MGSLNPDYRGLHSGVFRKVKQCVFIEHMEALIQISDRLANRQIDPTEYYRERDIIQDFIDREFKERCPMGKKDPMM
jgi:hypothetical protein